MMKRNGNAEKPWAGGVAGWLLGRLKSRLRTGEQTRPRLELLERVTLAPRQSLALVEAEGRRFLVATSPEGAPAFYPLDGLSAAHARAAARPVARVSW